ncbi:major facilitator superfamily domain-containing protein [Aspergillus karnatakaensis]|uniref:major facilitator superfamily domain-containing protein n=1 Tax=Aspergillus karnatakaensis TaxID=1810916 RepID=UPI003CCE446F
MDDSNKDGSESLSAKLAIDQRGEADVGIARSEFYIDPVTQKQIYRKFDQYAMPQLFLIACLAYLDRSNLGNAKVFGLVEDLDLKGLEFNNLSTLFGATYIIFEIPWTMAIKKWGANRMIALAMVAWSIVTLCSGFIQNYAQAVVVRLLLGAFEAGLTPGLAFIFSTIYERQGTSKRVALIYLANVTSGAFGGLIAYGIQLMGMRRGLEPWRWLFIIEGSISVVLGGCCWLTFPRNPETAWFLAAEEKAIMQVRKQRDIVYKGSDEFDSKWVKEALRDPFVYMSAVCFFSSSIAIFGFGIFLPTIINGLGFSSLQANYLTIPVYGTGALVLIIITFLSDRLNKRAQFLIVTPVPVVVGYLISVVTPNPGAGYFAMFLCCSGIYSYNALILTWVTTNLAPDYKRSVGVALFTSLSGISSLIAPQLYPSSDGPRYQIGNGVSLAFEVLAGLNVIFVFFLLKRRNSEKERLRGEGKVSNGLEGDRELGFMYVL